MDPDGIRVVQLIRGLDIGGLTGGAERFGLELARELNRRGHQVILAAFYHYQTAIENYWMECLNKEGIQTILATPWAGDNNLPGFINGIKTLSAALVQPVDICHSHFPLGTLAALILRRKKRSKIALRTAHNVREWDAGKNAWIRQLLFMRWLYPILLDAEVGVSQAVVDQLMKHPGARFAHHKPQLIYNAIPPIQESPGSPPKAVRALSRESEVIIGTVGRLTEQKGHRYLLQAIPAILEAFPGARFWFIGDGELREELKNLAKSLGIAGAVKFLGVQEDVPALLRQMDLFVLPSLWEGLPTVILEAMACNVPVIATDIPGTRELIQNEFSGWLVPPKDATSLSRCIIDVIKNEPARSKSCWNALETLKKYEIAAISDQYTALYFELLRRPVQKEK